MCEWPLYVLYVVLYVICSLNMGLFSWPKISDTASRKAQNVFVSNYWVNVSCIKYNKWVNHEQPKGSEIMCSRKSEHVLPHMSHASQFTQSSMAIRFINTNWITLFCTQQAIGMIMNIIKPNILHSCQLLLQVRSIMTIMTGHMVHRTVHFPGNWHNKELSSSYILCNNQFSQ